MNYLLAHALFTEINHEPIDLHYKFNTFSRIFVPLLQVTYNIIIYLQKAPSWSYKLSISRWKPLKV